MSDLSKNLIERLDEFTARQGIVSGEWCKLLDRTEKHITDLESKLSELEKMLFTNIMHVKLSEAERKLKVARDKFAYISNHQGMLSTSLGSANNYDSTAKKVADEALKEITKDEP